MLIDITMRITPQMIKDSPGKDNKVLSGHVGTHFDAMNREFPLTYTQRRGIAFDVSTIRDRDIGIADIPIEAVQPEMFVAFYSGFAEEIGYEGKNYFTQHPQLSHELIDALVERGVSIIALDFAGIRRGAQHVPKDQYCADRGTFVVENLCNLKELVDRGGQFKAHTYPMPLTQTTGLPCRVIAEL